MGISIIIPNYSDNSNLKRCLKYISEQNFNKKNLEIIIAQGKKNLIIKNKYNLNIKQIFLGYPNNQEARKFKAVKSCKFEIICFLDTDNFIIDKNFLKTHYDVFINEDINFSYCKFYSYDNVNGVLNKYFALLGGNDPVAWFFKKNDRNEYLNHKVFNIGYNIVKKRKKYLIINYKKINTTIGANGFFVRKKIYKNLNFRNPSNLFHIDTNIELLNKEKNKKFALINTEIVHQTSHSIFKNLIKRINYFDNFYFNKLNERTFKIVDIQSIKDLLRLFILIIYGITLIYPIFFSLIKFLKTGKIEWLLHVIFINLFIFTYAYISSKLILKKICNV